MQITIAEIINAKPAIEKLTQQTLPARKSYQISKLLKALNDEYELFESTRVELVKKYGAINDDGTWIADSSNPEFISEVQSILSISCNIQDELKVDLSQELDSIQLTVSDVMALDPFFRFE